MILDLTTDEGRLHAESLGQVQVLDVTRGRWLTFVAFVDTEKGICRCWKTTIHGTAMFDPNGDFAIEELRGRFAVVPLFPEPEGGASCTA